MLTLQEIINHFSSDNYVYAPSKDISLLLSRHENGYNAFMLIVLEHRDALPKILAAVEQFSSRESWQILSQCDIADIDGDNPLTLAARYQPTAVEPILNLIKKLSKSDRYGIYQNLILNQENDEDYNALMLAARYQPTAVESILAMIPTDQLCNRFGLDPDTGYNVLMLAARYQPTAVAPILTAMKNLSSKQQTDIFTRTGFHDRKNALMLAAHYQPTTVNLIFEAIALSNIELDVKYKLFHGGLGKYRAKLPANSDVFRIIWEKDSKDLLEQLKPASSMNKDEPDKGKGQMNLYNSLKNDLNIYLQSNKKTEELKKFHTDWNKRINEARTDKDLMGSPQVQEILSTILLMLSVIGTIYLAYQAVNNYRKDRSLFFASPLEKTLNTLQDEAQKVRPYEDAEEKKIASSIPDENTPIEEELEHPASINKIK